MQLQALQIKPMMKVMQASKYSLRTYLDLEHHIVKWSGVARSKHPYLACEGGTLGGAWTWGAYTEVFTLHDFQARSKNFSLTSIAGLFLMNLFLMKLF